MQPWTRGIQFGLRIASLLFADGVVLMQQPADQLAAEGDAAGMISTSNPELHVLCGTWHKTKQHNDFLKV